MNKQNVIFRTVTGVLKKNVFFAVLLVAAIVASVLLQLAPAFIIRQIVDVNFSKGILKGVWLLALYYLLVSAGGNVIEFVKVAITTVLGQKILMDLRRSMADRLSSLSMRYFVNTPVGDIMSRLTTDVDAVNSLFSAGIINAVTNMFKVVGLVIAFYFMAPKLIWLPIAAIPVIYFMSNHFRKKIYSFQKAVRLAVSEIYTFIQEWLTGIKTVKAYEIEDKGKKKFNQLVNNQVNAVNSISSYDSWFPCVLQMAQTLVIALALWFGTNNGTTLSLGLTVGTLASLCTLINQIFSPVQALAQQIQTIQQSMAGLSRLREFFNQPVEDRPEISQTPDDHSGIEIESLDFAYDQKNILKDLNASIQKGEKAVFIGRSGAGKTTLMNIVAGLYAPNAGSIRINGVDPYTLPPTDRRRIIGIVPQMPQIFDGTIADNITLLDDTITREQMVNAARTVGIHEKIASMPDGYDTVIGEGAVGLSSGEVQLLSITRAIAANPSILLLDEPTSGMDAKTEQQVFAAIREASRGRTIFSISHRISGIVDADKIYIVANGRIVESGTPEQLAGTNGWFAMYRNMEKAGWNFA